jgi:predicted tellurium resistance membrane protein TerC
LTIAALLAFLGWVAWAMPVEDMAGAPAVDADAFWAASGVSLLACMTVQAIRALSRKRGKG